MVASTFTMHGKRFVILPEAEYRRLRESKRSKLPQDEWGLPPLPAKLANGNYPAMEYARAVTARDLIRSRRALGLSQAELAHQAGVRVETLNRIERAKMNASPAIMEKLDAVLNQPTKGRS
jgi:ribosome-binding protein aMBF1 (putative translation factor)